MSRAPRCFATGWEPDEGDKDKISERKDEKQVEERELSNKSSACAEEAARTATDVCKCNSPKLIRPLHSLTAATRAPLSPWKHQLTQRHHQEAHVVEPVGCLVGELSDEELQDGSEVTLAAHRRHLHWSGHGRVTVTAKRRETAFNMSARVRSMKSKLKTVCE